VKKLLILMLFSMPVLANNISTGYLGVDSFFSGSKGSIQYGAQFSTGNEMNFGYELDYTRYESHYSYGVNIKPSFSLVNRFFISPIAGFHKFSSDEYSPIYGLEASHYWQFIELKVGVKKTDASIEDDVNYYAGVALRF